MPITIHFNIFLYCICFHLFVSQFRHYRKFGLDTYLLWGASAVCRMYSSNPGFYPLGASSTFPDHDCQKHLQTLSNVPCVAKSSWLRKTGLGHYVANLFCSRSDLVLLLISQLFSLVLKVYLSIVLYSVCELFILVSKYIYIFLSLYFSSHLREIYSFHQSHLKFIFNRA